MSRPRESGSASWWRLDAVGAAAIVLLTAGAWLLVVRPMARERAVLSSLRGQLAEAGRESDRLHQERSRRQAELQRLEEELAASSLRLQPAEHLNRRLAIIVEQATKSGLEISGTRAGDVARGGRFDMVPIEVAGDGTYSACAAFLHRVHEALPDVEVLGFELSGRGGQPSDRSVFRFDLSWYAAPAVADATTGGDAPR